MHGFVRATAGRMRLAQHAQTQAAIRPRGRAHTLQTPCFRATSGMGSSLLGTPPVISSRLIAKTSTPKCLKEAKASLQELGWQWGLSGAST